MKPEHSLPDCRPSTIIVPFAVDPSEATPFTKGSHVARLRAYYRSAIATFWTLRRFNPGLHCRLATNAELPLWAMRQMACLRVEVEHVEPKAMLQLPTGTTFRTSLYLFDVVRATLALKGSTVVYLDPDVLCIRPLNLALKDGEIGFLPLGTGPEDSIKGVTLTQIATARARSGLPFARHVGGEILMVTPSALAGLQQGIDEALSGMEGANRPLFLNEEHVLTYVSDAHWRSLRSEVARVWTSPRYRDVPDDVGDLALWHLPAEKTRGLARVYRAVSDGSMDRLPDDDVRRRCRLWTGITPTTQRRIGDHIAEWFSARRFI